jgi:hypothetical protein
MPIAIARDRDAGDAILSHPMVADWIAARVRETAR